LNLIRSPSYYIKWILLKLSSGHNEYFHFYSFYVWFKGL
jgi:hypothetical protein